MRAASSRQGKQGVHEESRLVPVRVRRGSESKVSGPIDVYRGRTGGDRGIRLLSSPQQMSGACESASRAARRRRLFRDRNGIAAIVDVDLVGERNEHAEGDDNQQDREQIRLPSAAFRGHEHTSDRFQY